MLESDPFIPEDPTALAIIKLVEQSFRDRLTRKARWDWWINRHHTLEKFTKWQISLLSFIGCQFIDLGGISIRGLMDPKFPFYDPGYRIVLASELNSYLGQHILGRVTRPTQAAFIPEDLIIKETAGLTLREQIRVAAIRDRDLRVPGTVVLHLPPAEYVVELDRVLGGRGAKIIVNNSREPFSVRALDPVVNTSRLCIKPSQFVGVDARIHVEDDQVAVPGLCLISLIMPDRRGLLSKLIGLEPSYFI